MGGKWWASRGACGGLLGGILSRQKTSPGKLWGGCAACYVMGPVRAERFGVEDLRGCRRVGRRG